MEIWVISSSSDESISWTSSSGEKEVVFGEIVFSGVILLDFLMKCCEMSCDPVDRDFEEFGIEDWRERLKKSVRVKISVYAYILNGLQSVRRR